MADVTMCKGERCPAKDRCYRYRAKPSKYRQSFFANVPWDAYMYYCESFVEYQPAAERGEKGLGK